MSGMRCGHVPSVGPCRLPLQKRGYFSKAYSTWGLNLTNGPYSKTYTPMELVEIKKKYQEKYEEKAAALSKGVAVLFAFFCVFLLERHLGVPRGPQPPVRSPTGACVHDSYCALGFVAGAAAATEVEQRLRLSRKKATDPTLTSLLGVDPYASMPSVESAEPEGHFFGLEHSASKAHAAVEAKRRELAARAEGRSGAPTTARSEFDAPAAADDDDGAERESDSEDDRGINDMYFPKMGVRIAGPPKGHEGVPGPFLELTKRPPVGLKPSGQVTSPHPCAGFTVVPVTQDVMSQCTGTIAGAWHWRWRWFWFW